MHPATLLMLGRRRSSGAAGEAGPITAGRNYFTDAAGRPWTYQGVTMFLLFSRWLNGENIGPVCDWCASLGANVVRVLGMVAWPGQAFGPNLTSNWWAGLLPFLDYLAARRLRVEFTVFAGAQIVMPDQGELHALQAVMLRDLKVLAIGSLTYDNEHRVNADRRHPNGSHPKRISLWELHPVLAFYVCPKRMTCDPEMPNVKWQTLKEWRRTHPARR